MGREPLSGASLGLTGQSNSNPHLTRAERLLYSKLRDMGVTHERILFGLQWDRDNERLAAALKALPGPCGRVERGN